MTLIKNSSFFIPYLTMYIGLYLFENIWIAILSYHILVILFLVKDKHIEKLPILIKGWNFRSTVVFGILFSLNGLLIIFFSNINPNLFKDISDTLQNLGLVNESWLIFILYYSLATPIIEELFWRSYHKSNSRKISKTDLIFAGYHIIVLVLFIDLTYVFGVFCSLIFASWLWRYFYRKYNGLIVSVITHSVADLSTILSINFIATNGILQ